MHFGPQEKCAPLVSSSMWLNGITRHVNLRSCYFHRDRLATNPPLRGNVRQTATRNHQLIHQLRFQGERLEAKPRNHGRNGHLAEVRGEEGRRVVAAL